jgi:hypothetical protein
LHRGSWRGLVAACVPSIDQSGGVAVKMPVNQLANFSARAGLLAFVAAAFGLPADGAWWRTTADDDLPVP